jgi:stage III sporulation protein AG
MPHLKAPDRKTARWLAVLLAAGLGLLLVRPQPRPAAAPGRAPAAAGGAGGASGAAAQPSDPVAAEEDALSRSLAALLGEVPGAGRVWVHVTLSGTDSQRLATDTTSTKTTTTERDNQGGTRTVVEETNTDKVVLGHSGSGDAPVPVQTTRPQVVGVLVVAAGASDPAVRAALTQAVAVGLGIPAYRVAVLPGRQDGGSP